MKNLSLGYSPCPNDTFIFYAMVHSLIDSMGFTFNEVLLDVETLNQMALRKELDISKVSHHAFGGLRKDYCMLRSGGALGKGCGPLLIGAEAYSISELKDKRIAIPGRLTTAYLLLQLFDPDFKIGKADISVMPFNEIMPAIKNGDVDAGLIIHESRFTYPSYGLKEIIDLGKWWEEETGLLLPLGCIIARRGLGAEAINAVDNTIHKSIEFAFNNRDAVMRYIKEHAQELSDDVINRHIDLYVNKYSLDTGADGEEAVKELLLRAEGAGIIQKADEPLFI
ncbi:MAG: 1,4-dihydroxy-6-naphthoate synthase [Nitrospirae bacterium]|nr:1,4-dihydroxy-6-naphthoate synthase [Nitrospirota bacterium]